MSLAMSPCGTNSSWLPTVANWVNANTDAKFANWATTLQPGDNLANKLASTYGDLTDFRCGIGLQSSCVITSLGRCVNLFSVPVKDRKCITDLKWVGFSAENEWAYLVVLAMVNMNQYLNMFYVSVALGQCILD